LQIGEWIRQKLKHRNLDQIYGKFGIKQNYKNKFRVISILVSVK